MEDVKKFLKQQKLLVLSTVDKEGNPWSCNVYFSVNDNVEIFFVSPTSTNHVQHLKHNSKVSFSVPWYNDAELSDRKAIQGTGLCSQVKNPRKIASLLKNHAKYFPLWKDTLTYKNMNEKTIASRPFIIKPDYMKFWNDELYGAEGIREFEVS